MNSLYIMILDVLQAIMNFNDVASAACELVAICATILITYYIVLMPLRIIIRFVFKKVKL